MTSQSAEIKSILKFLLLSYLISWVVWLPGILATRGVVSDIPWPPLFGLGACGPLAAALWLTCQEGGWSAVKDWLKDGFKAPLTPTGWLVVLTTPFLIPPLALWIDKIAGGTHADLQFLQQPAVILPTLVLMLTIGGAQEEYGWRGYLLPRLDRILEPWKADTLMIIVHVCWHIPLFSIAYTVQSQYSFWLFLAFGVGFTTLINHIYRGTGGSILAAVLFHGLVNTGLEIFPPVASYVSHSPFPLLIIGCSFFIMAILLRLASLRQLAPGPDPRD